MGIRGKVWETPLKNMKIYKDRAVIKAVPILSTGLWKGILVAESNINEVISFQKEDGPCHVVLDHDEAVQNWVGTADKYMKKTHEDGYVVILSDLEIVDKPTIEKLSLIKEKGGGLFGISPRIEWDEKDEDGNIEGLKTPHVSIVVDPAQGLITRLSDNGLMVIQIGKNLANKDTKPNTCKCPKCGATTEKEFGKPCQGVKCPKCGTKMIGVHMEDGSMKTKKEELFLMKVSDFKAQAKCPKCGAIIPKDAKKCPKCGEKLDATEQITAICPECQGAIDTDAGVCSKCGKTIDELGYIIPFPVGANEEVTLPKDIAQEIDQLLRNPNVESPELKGFLEKLRETLKKKKKKPDEEEDPEGKEDEAKKKKEKEKEEDPDGEDEQGQKCPECGAEIPDGETKCPKCGAKIEPKAKKDEDPPVDDKGENKSYAFPPRNGIEKVNEAIYSKELLKTGVFKHPEEPGFIPIDKTFITRLAENTNEIFSGRTPVYIGHPEVGKEPADKIVGWVTDYKAGDSLRGKVEITNALVKDRVDEKTLRDASLGISFAFTDEKGRNRGPVATHLAITTTPYIRGLEEFKSLVASRTDMKVEELVEVDGSQFSGQKVAEMQRQLDETNSKLEKLMRAELKKTTDAVLERVDGLIEAKLLKPAASERFSEYVKKAAKLTYDEEHSMAEALLDILETGLQKGEVNLGDKQLTQNTSTTTEYLTSEDMDKYTGRLTSLEREGIIEIDKAGRPFWAKARP